MTEQDDREKVRRYLHDAERGDAFARVSLGFFYETGRGGLPKNEREAARLYKLAADQGNATAQSYLGSFYRDGLGGLPQNDQEAARLFKLAAEQADTSGQVNLGFFYEKGRGGLPRDEREAARLYKLAAAKNSAYARDALARLSASSDDSGIEVRVREIASFSPGRVFRSGLGRTISSLIMAAIFGAIIFVFAQAGAPAALFIFLGLFFLIAVMMFFNGIGRMRAASSKDIYFRAGPGGIFLRFPVELWVSYPVYNYHVRWEDVAQLQWFIRKLSSDELRIFLKSGGRLTVPSYLFDKSAGTLRDTLWEARKAP